MKKKSICLLHCLNSFKQRIIFLSFILTTACNPYEDCISKDIDNNMIDQGLYNKFKQDQVFLNICERYSYLQIASLKDSGGRKNDNLDLLDNLSVVIKSYGKKNNCENIIDYVDKFIDIDKTILSRCSDLGFNCVSRDWIDAWQFYRINFVCNIFEMQYSDVNAIKDDLLTFLQFRDFNTYRLYNDLKDLNIDDVVNYSCEQIKSTYHSHWTGGSGNINLIDEMNDASKGLYKDFFSYYISGEWRNFVIFPEENECKECGRVPCICHLWCPYCQQSPCLCFDNKMCFKEILHDSNYDWVINFFRESFPNMPEVFYTFECIYNFYGDYWMTELDRHFSGNVLNIKDQVCSPFAVIPVNSDDKYGKGIVHTHWDISDNDIAINLNDLLQFDLYHNTYGYSFSFIVNYDEIFILVNDSNIQKEADDWLLANANMEQIYQEESDKIKVVGLEPRRHSLYTMAAVLKRVCPEVKLLHYIKPSNYSNTDRLVVVDVATGEYDVEEHPCMYCLIEGIGYYSECEYLKP